ncbi:uncharacterized protein LOC105794606 isoform X1 [Gossypium raimondii]|uniref:uncharacterized protein LOC105794606 isoform X1 n=1 Tax=Gossypium raimondii TaxID=29730 RepID=UPI00227C2CFF|nr:uncharacterized protein LOC105794606 isoform X1 [Gossypium raimondii]XP_052484438.1 uncharacterized protein LOC105794606 isoform X1 [Gossypium raimondii]XP_052484440.1 uncharacterized protein LOC105794606 isoform X1 [Gossypium raimondii]
MEGLDTLIMRKKQSSKSSSLESNGSSSNQTSSASQWFSSKSSKKELTLDLNQRPTDLLLLCRELMKEVFQGTLLLSRQTCHSVASLLSELHFCQSLSVLKCHIQIGANGLENSLGKKVYGMHMSLENLFCFRTWI